MATAAPILVFAYNRPHHLRLTLEALAANELASESHVVIYSDGPKNPEAESLVRAVREVAHAARGFASFRVIERERNMGLAPNIIDGVTKTVQEHGRVIVVEDDLVTSPHFLRYMNDALAFYADNPKVASIHGWLFPHRVHNPPETFFLRGADCWGWATWKRAWDLFESDAGKQLTELKRRGLEKAFNADGNYDYTGMLQSQLQGKISSWAVRWHATAFLATMYTLYPGRSLVRNIGIDGSGTHCGKTDSFISALSEIPIQVSPIPVQENAAMRHARNVFYGQADSAAGKLLGTVAKLKHALFSASKAPLKSLAKDWLPPAVVRLLRRGVAMERVNLWEGDYPDWSSACADAEGYDTDEIFKKVRDACRQVRDGKAVSERDSVLFDTIEYSWPLLAGLMWAAARHNGALRLIDFGGSLGSTYRQNIRFLAGLVEVRWNIVEQEQFVNCGRGEFETNNLRFFTDADSCLRESRADGILFASVLQYMEDPYLLLREAASRDFDYILMDRTPFTPDDKDRITVQHVPEQIYKASYPCRFLSRSRFIEALGNKYEIVEWFEAPIGGPGWYGCIARRRI